MNARTCNKGYKVMVELMKNELVHDIKNTAYSFAESENIINTKAGQVESMPETLEQVYTIGEDGNREKLARILDSAVEDCMELLFRFCKMEMRGGGFDSNEWEECVGSPTNDEEAYYLAMLMPIGFSKTSVHTMTVYMHDYIVYECLYEWMMIVYPNGAERFKVLAEDKKQKMKDASNRTAGRERIRLHPF